MIYKLKYIGDKVVVASLPLSSWTIVNTNTLSISGNTVTQLGVGGWYESMYKSFTVPATGSYTISYDYDIASGVVGGHGTYGFGLWLTTNNPNVSGDPQYQFYANSANRTGGVIAGASTNMAGMKGNITFTASLTANTTYYLWYPGAALDDGTTYKLTFRNIAVNNNPIQYTADRDIKFNGTRVTYDYDPFVQYDYMTFKAGSGSYSIQADPVNWVVKVWTNSYLYDLTAGTQASLKASNRDAFYMSYGNSHVYRAEWTDADINSTKNASSRTQQYWNQFSVFYGGEKFSGIVELYSIDFWHKPLWNNTGFPDVTIIPQDARNIHRGAELTNCSNLFKNAPITNSIEKFILATQTACPNLTTTSGCFAGCTTAPDYAYCLTNYPNWF